MNSEQLVNYIEVVNLMLPNWHSRARIEIVDWSPDGTTLKFHNGLSKEPKIAVVPHDPFPYDNHGVLVQVSAWLMEFVNSVF